MATNPKAKKIIIWSSVAVVLGVGGYFIYRFFKNRNKGGGDLDATSFPSSSPSPTSSPAPVSEVVSDRPTSSDDIKAFQDWMDKNRPFWIKDTDGKYKNLRVGTASEPNRHVGGKGYGTFGQNTENAWRLFGQEYKSKTVSPSSQNAQNDPELERAINLILAKATGAKAKRSYLEKTSASFVKKWASMINADRKAFTWGSKTWRSKTGEMLLDFDPIGVSMKTNSNGISAYQFPSQNSAKITVGGNLNVGKVRAITFDGESVWFYLPDNGGNYKWGRAIDFKKA
jgi:hypothetical protein